MNYVTGRARSLLRRSRYLGLVLTILASWQCSLFADETPAQSDLKQKLSQVNVPMKTLGGRQLWGDVHFFQGWTIQQNVLTGHFRLLDPRDVRHAWGSFDVCKEKLDQIRDERKLPAMKGEAVVLLHGIFRSSKAMSRVQDRLEKDGYLVVPFDYPSTRVDIAASAKMLGQVVESLEGVEKISFVTHSLGGLVVRSWLGQGGDERARCLVMMGTPNKGAEVADILRNWHLYRLILGPAGQQLVADQSGDIAKLPIPEIPFSVIAGGKGTTDGYNPLIPGDDDGLVAASSAYLGGAEDSMTLPVLHSFLPFNAAVIDAVSLYLKTGAFREDGVQRPVEQQAVLKAASESQ
ncbi:MAG: esterase/lipase family protein [Planctomycetales bacterium]|jgi:pimeloyl-ACP methyl ester carboxylesterase